MRSVETVPKLVVVLSRRASLSCVLLVLDSSSLEMALVLQSHPAPHGSRGLLILQSGCPSAPGLFLPASWLLPRICWSTEPVSTAFCGCSPGQEGSVQLWVRAPETLRTNKPCENPHTDFQPHLIFCSQSNGHFDDVYLK